MPHRNCSQEARPANAQKLGAILVLRPPLRFLRPTVWGLARLLLRHCSHLSQQPLRGQPRGLLHRQPLHQQPQQQKPTVRVRRGVLDTSAPHHHTAHLDGLQSLRVRSHTPPVPVENQRGLAVADLRHLVANLSSWASRAASFEIGGPLLAGHSPTLHTIFGRYTTISVLAPLRVLAGLGSTAAVSAISENVMYFVALAVMDIPPSGD